MLLLPMPLAADAMLILLHMLLRRATARHCYARCCYLLSLLMALFRRHTPLMLPLMPLLRHTFSLHY